MSPPPRLVPCEGRSGLLSSPAGHAGPVQPGVSELPGAPLVPGGGGAGRARRSEDEDRRAPSLTAREEPVSRSSELKGTRPLPYGPPLGRSTVSEEPGPGTGAAGELDPAEPEEAAEADRPSREAAGRSSVREFEDEEPLDFEPEEPEDEDPDEEEPDEPEEDMLPLP